MKNRYKNEFTSKIKNIINERNPRPSSIFKSKLNAQSYPILLLLFGDLSAAAITRVGLLLYASGMENELHDFVSL